MAQYNRLSWDDFVVIDLSVQGYLKQWKQNLEIAQQLLHIYLQRKIDKDK